jgi:hypothetical protein
MGLAPGGTEPPQIEKETIFNDNRIYIGYKLLQTVIEGKIKGRNRSDRKTRKKT